MLTYPEDVLTLGWGATVVRFRSGEGWTRYCQEEKTLRYLMMLVLLVGLLTVQGDAPPAEADHTIPHRVTSLENKVTSLGNRVDAVEDDTTDLDDRIDGVDTRINGIDTRVDGVESSVDDIDTNIGTLLDRTDNLPTKLSNLQDEVDDVPEVVQNMREGRGKVTQEMLDAIDDEVEVLQIEITEERAGLDAFKTPTTAGQLCSNECVQFRKDMLDLLTNIESLSNTLIEVDPSLGISAQMDLSRTRELIQTLPPAGLYPLYRATNQDADILGSGLVDLLGDLKDDIQAVAVGTRTGSGAGTSNLSVGAQSGSVIDSLTQCGEIMQDPFTYERRARKVHSAGLAIMGTGKLLDAWGGTRVIDKEVQVHGYVGFAVKNNYRKQAGIFLEGVGDALIALGSYGFGKLRYCTTLDATQRCDLEIAVDEQTAGTNQEDFRFSVLTAFNGKRTDHLVDLSGDESSPFMVFVNDRELSPGVEYGVTELFEGVREVSINSDALPQKGESFLLT